MRNNFFKFFILISIICSISHADDQFIFETSKIDILNEGNLIIAEEGRAQSIDGDLIINAKKFEYKKDQKIIKAFSGIAYFKSNNLEIEFGEITSNQLTQITTAKNNVKIFDLDKKLSIETSLVNFDKKENILISPTTSIVKDKINNLLKTSSFHYNLNDEILKLQNAELKDIYDNNFNIEIAYLNTTSNELVEERELVKDLL